MKVRRGLGLVLLLFFCSSRSFAASGDVIIHLPGLNEKQIDSLQSWFAGDKNISQAGFCLENKLLFLHLTEKDPTQVNKIFEGLKINGQTEFNLKEEISADRFFQNCQTFISFR